MGTDLPSARLLFQEAKDLLAHGVAVGGRIDDKAANLATFNSVVLGLLATAFTLATPPRAAWLLALSWSGPLLLFASTLCALRAYRPMEYALALSATTLEAALDHNPREEDLLRSALHAYCGGVGKNDAHVKAKVAWLRRSLRLLAAGLAASTCTVAFMMLLGGWGLP